MHPKKRQRKNASAMKLVGKLAGLFRNAAGLTQVQLTERASVQAETIASIEQGRRFLLPDLARSVDEILDTKAPPSPSPPPPGRPSPPTPPGADSRPPGQRVRSSPNQRTIADVAATSAPR
ncbi:multiprotein-bridging factor 1 family protein [Streptomyces sp. NPDC005794]|uniref:helix-turn-helix domain-containing protein n=1 Tax=Streptomyces sp. NPDC005794 TaxID=3364733 RepID=UPI00368CCA95